jgi:cell wall-associated NlpC family hydrolase
MGEKVNANELQPGDLVFYNTLRRSFSHVGIYLGDNRFIHAASRGGQVQVDNMEAGYWKKRFNGARRISQPE